MKVLHPAKWWAIRGNHETREVNGNQVSGPVDDGRGYLSAMAGEEGVASSGGGG